MAWSNKRANLVEKNAVKLTILCKAVSPMLGTAPGNPEVYSKYIAANSPDVPKVKIQQEIELLGEEETERQGTTRFLRGPMFHDATNPYKWYDPADILHEVPKTATEERMNLMWDFQMAGFFKEKISFLQRASDKTVKSPKKSKEETRLEESMKDGASDFLSKSGKKKFACSDLKAYKKVVNGLIKIENRKIPILFPKTFWDDERGEMPSLDPNGLPWVNQRPLRAETAQGPRVALASSEVAPAGSMWSCTINILDPVLVPVVEECLDFGQFVGMLQNRGNGYGKFIWTPIDPNTGEIID